MISTLNSMYSLQIGLLEKVNNVNIILIPKKDASLRAYDFRPINLVHWFGKLLTKILAMRLSSVIRELISKAPSAFIKRRSIQENFMYVRNLARAYHRTKTPSLLFK